MTIDDLAVRAGDLHLAQQITAEVARAALPEFYFHQRGELSGPLNPGQLAPARAWRA